MDTSSVSLSAYSGHRAYTPSSNADDVEMDDPAISKSFSSILDINEEGRIPLRRVEVPILCLKWGGEFISNPCQLVYGWVLDMELNGRDKKVCFEVDFDSHFSVQLVPIDSCVP